MANELTDEEEEEWTAEDWAEWVPSILEAIETGMLDLYLKSIARACFERRGKREGDAGKYVTAEPSIVRRPVAGQDTAVTSVEVPAFTGTIQPLPSGKRYTPSSVFELNGKVYRRADLIGKVIKPPLTTLPSASLRGTKLRVIGVGPATVKVEIVSLPNATTNRTWKRRLADREEFFMKHAILDDVLG